MITPPVGAPLIITPPLCRWHVGSGPTCQWHKRGLWSKSTQLGGVIIKSPDLSLALHIDVQRYNGVLTPGVSLASGEDLISEISLIDMNVCQILNYASLHPWVGYFGTRFINFMFGRILASYSCERVARFSIRESGVLQLSLYSLLPHDKYSYPGNISLVLIITKNPQTRVVT
jgi:hypothetical protein